MTTTFDGNAGPALVVSELTKKFPGKLAVDGLSFSVNRSDIACLLGPNGAGKTTTIEMCEGFTAPTSGSVRILGLDPAREPDRVRSRIGIMLQGGGAYAGIRVKEMLDLAASYSANPLSPDWLLDILGLQGVARTTYRRLSGGQQQRLSLALALIGRPELVFLDEPTAGMDAQSRIAVWDLVRALKADGVTVVLTTHLMDEAEALADQVIIIDHGRKVAEGTPGELMAASTSHGIRMLTDAALDTAALTAAGLPTEVLRPLHYAVEAEATPETLARLTAELARQDVLVRRLETGDSTLENVFLTLTGRELRS